MPRLAEKYKEKFSTVTLFTIDEVFGGWAKAQKTHFDDGGDLRPDLRQQELITRATACFSFKGRAKIDKDWEAGYKIEIGVRSANSKRFTQDNDEVNILPTDTGFDLRDLYWYLKSKKLGQGSVGQQATATDQITDARAGRWA